MCPPIATTVEVDVQVAGREPLTVDGDVNLLKIQSVEHVWGHRLIVASGCSQTRGEASQDRFWRPASMRGLQQCRHAARSGGSGSTSPDSGAETSTPQVWCARPGWGRPPASREIIWSALFSRRQLPRPGGGFIIGLTTLKFEFVFHPVEYFPDVSGESKDVTEGDDRGEFALATVAMQLFLSDRESEVVVSSG